MIDKQNYPFAPRRGVESPHKLLAGRVPSTPRPSPLREIDADLAAVTIQWLRPGELTTRVATAVAARVVVRARRRELREVAAALAARRERLAAQGRLAPASAFGRHGPPSSSVPRPGLDR